MQIKLSVDGETYMNDQKKSLSCSLRLSGNFKWTTNTI